MEIDQALLESLPVAKRQKLCKQLRQEQVKRYNQHIKLDKNVNSQQKKNKKERNVNFLKEDVIKDATTEFNDREVLVMINRGCNPNTSGHNGTTLLHKCCLNDNFSAAEILIQHGAMVNVVDNDLWTPLHMACDCDSLDIVQLLLNNGADVGALDVDGNYPIDHTSNSSESRILVQNHMAKNGWSEDKLKEIRLKTPRVMLQDVKDLIQNETDLNAVNDQGITLLHIASASGYREVIRQLLGTGQVDVNLQDKDGWSPLHVASRYCQYKIVRQLLKCDADPNMKTSDGLKASQMASMEKIKQTLVKYEQKNRDVDVNENDDEEESAITATRINSKVLRPRHVTLSKKEELLEARRWKPTNEELEQERRQTQARQGDDKSDDDGSDNDDTDEDDPYENISYLRKDDKIASQEVELPGVKPNDDLACLPEITEQVILTEIGKRYKDNQIYTYVGDILIACNPFKSLPIYNRLVSRKYHNASLDRSSLAPHIYAIAENAYSSMMHENVSQSCIISGESGAGKTESCKYLLQHLLQTAESEEQGLNQKIHQVNPLLEAFGNAQTIMNDNSSRFGKYIELKFNDTGFVQGGKITEYLLEKSRVVRQGKGERNFHIFYLMLAGMSPDQYKMLGLEPSNEHRYLSHKDVDFRSLISTEKREQFQEIIECMKFVGFSQDDIEHLMSTIAAILLLGDVVFKAVGNNDAAKITNPQLVRKVSALLHLPMGELDSALVSEVTITRGEQIKKERTVTQAQDCTDALSKGLYGRLFSWIVNGINQLIQPVEESGPIATEIGVLDIFGFENFPKNSFEQICINLANEQLQNFFNKSVFEKEEEDCYNEGVSLVDIQFTSNQPTLELFLMKHVGLFSLLDEESRFPKATDKTLASKLHSGPGKKYPALYMVPKGGGTIFSIMHYAGKVQYDLQGVLDKNRDTLPNSVLFTMKSSDSLLVKEMFQSRMTRTGSLAPSTRQQKSRKITDTKTAFEFFQKKRRQSKGKSRVFKAKSKKERPVMGTERKGLSTVAYHFKNSLADLMNKMNSARPHFIRCIKPNMLKTSGSFETQYVLAQLRYTGVMETTKIRRQGYSMRIAFEDFLLRYDTIGICAVHQDYAISPLVKCKQALQYCQVTDFQVGKTKLFFRYWHVDKLEQITASLERKVVVTQKVMRGWMERKQFSRLLKRKKQQDAYVATFLANISDMFSAAVEAVLVQKVHDADRQKKEKEQKEKDEKEDLLIEQKRKEARVSLEVLDAVLNEHDSVPEETKDGPLLTQKLSIRQVRAPPTPDEAADTIASMFTFSTDQNPSSDHPSSPTSTPPSSLSTRLLLHGRAPSYKLPPPPDVAVREITSEDSFPMPPPAAFMEETIMPPPPPLKDEMEPVLEDNVLGTDRQHTVSSGSGSVPPEPVKKPPPPVAPKPKMAGRVAVFPMSIMNLAASNQEATKEETKPPPSFKPPPVPVFDQDDEHETLLVTGKSIPAPPILPPALPGGIPPPPPGPGAMSLSSSQVTGGPIPAPPIPPALPGGIPPPPPVPGAMSLSSSQVTGGPIPAPPIPPALPGGIPPPPPVPGNTLPLLGVAKEIPLPPTFPPGISGGSTVPPPTGPRLSPGGLLDGLTNVKLKPVSDKGKEDPSVKAMSNGDGDGEGEGHSALIAQIQTGIKLKRSPGPKIMEIHNANGQDPAKNGNSSDCGNKQHPEHVTLSTKDTVAHGGTDDSSRGQSQLPPPSPSLTTGDPDPDHTINTDPDTSSSLSKTSSSVASPRLTPPPPIDVINSIRGPPPVLAPPKMPGAAGPLNSNSDKINKLPIANQTGSDIPAWKKEMEERKRKEQETIDQTFLTQQKVKEEKWSKIPEWQRPLVRKKEEEQHRKEEEEKKKREIELEKTKKCPWKSNKSQGQLAKEDEKKLLKEDEEKWMKIVNKNKTLEDNL